MKFEYIASFKKGDEVPSWLFSIDPSAPGTARPTLRFDFDCHVVEVSQGLFVVPDNEVEGLAAYSLNEGGGSHAVSAASRTVITPLRFLVLTGPDDDRGSGAGVPNSPTRSVGV